jgi:hypothetical protein
MSQSEKEILSKLNEKERKYSLPNKILEEIYEEERQVLYKGRKRNMEEKILRIIGQYSEKTDLAKLKEVLGEDDNPEN